MAHTNKHGDTTPSEKLNRRKFLTFVLGALPGALAACHAQPAQGSHAQPTSTRQPSPTPSPSPTSNDWSALAKSLQGSLVLPGSAPYATAHQLFDPRFDTIQPTAIAYCASPADVQSCLAFVRRFGLAFTPRAGGHSYAGYSTSTGLVVDVTRMHTVTVDMATGSAVVGAGARLIDVYNTLAQYGRALPAGSCPTVGIAGLTLGGGVGVLGRKFGLTCDNLLTAQVVTADGRLRTCDASHDPDLYWALRGGGGGNFGVVTSFTFRTYPVTTLALFTIDWPWSSAAAVVDAWQHWAPQAPDELWSNCLLLTNSDKSANPIIQVGGVYVGDVTALSPLLQQLTSSVNVATTNYYASDVGLLDTMLDEAGCYGKTIGECHLPGQDPNGQVQREITDAKSDYYSSTLSTQAIDALVNAITQRQTATTPGSAGIGLDAYGGAINRVAADATAFVHRNALFSAQYSTGWDPAAATAVATANHSWLTTLWQSMRPYVSGAAYQNYIDPQLTDWQQAYYGANLARLQKVKATYDADNLFHFKQSIPLATGT